MAKARRKRLRATPWAVLSLSTPTEKAVEHSFQDFRELAQSLADQHNEATAESAFIEAITADEVETILRENVLPELTRDLLEAGDYGRGLLMGTVLYVISEIEREQAEEAGL